jgi:hypothetical protein
MSFSRWRISATVSGITGAWRLAAGVPSAGAEVMAETQESRRGGRPRGCGNNHKPRQWLEPTNHQLTAVGFVCDEPDLRRYAAIAGARAAISIRRGARLSRNVGQPDHILAHPIMSHQAERRPGSGEIGLAVTKHDGVQIDSILIDQAQFGEAVR